jgi:hypothetical protein
MAISNVSMTLLQSMRQLNEDVVMLQASYKMRVFAEFTRQSIGIASLHLYVCLKVCQKRFIDVDTFSGSLEIALLSKVAEEAQRFCKAS